MNTLVALLTLVGLAACELQPAPPKKEPPAAPPPAAAPTEAPGGSAGSAVAPPPAPPPVAVVADAGVADAGPPKLVISAPCMEVGAHYAQVVIDSATDTAQRTIFEQERANLTRKAGEACTTQSWSEPARKCYLGTKTPKDVKACEEKFPPPKQELKQPKQPVAPVPGVGPTGTDMKTEQPKPARQPKPPKH